MIIRLLTVFLFLCSAFQATAQVTSTFDTDADGWTFTAVSTSIPVSHDPGGYATVTYSSNASATTQNWIAPAKFLGNHLALSLGMNLKFDLQQSVAGTGAGYDVLLRNGGNFIYISGITPKPAVAPAWTSYSFKLDETGGWYYSAGATPATRTQIKGILANVTSIEVRGTYATNASYTSGIDNVMLEQRTLATTPSGSTISATTGKAGDVITINGGGFDPVPSNNKVFFGYHGSSQAVVQSASPGQLTVEVPEGVVYGPVWITNTTTGLTGKTAQPFSPVFDGGGRIIPSSFKPRFGISTMPIESWFHADIDGDGWEDFAVANNNTEDRIDLYRNLGLGGDLSAASFDAPVSVAIPATGGSGTNGAGLWFIDLDGDGKKDAVSSNSTSAFSSAYVTLRNTGSPGTFSFDSPEYWAGGTDETPPYFIGDVDGDGRPELISGEGSSGAGTNLFISQNISTPGDIEFGPPVGYFAATVDGLSGVQMGDLNNDGKPDMIASWFFGDRFSIIQNNSTPGVISLTDMGQILTGQYNRGMRIVDMNLDGKNDLVWKRTSGGVYIRINEDADGILDPADFATEYILTSDLTANGGISIADINGDGKADIASTDDDDVGVYESVFAGGAFSGNSFSPAYRVLGTGGNSSGPGIADFNHDGKPDFIMATGGSVAIVQNANVAGPLIAVNTVSPIAAPVGATVTITGSNFSTVPAENHVYFGGVEAVVLSSTPTEIKASVPAGAGYGPVSVRKGELTSRYRLPFQTTFSSGVTFDNTHFGTPVNFTQTSANYDIDAGDLTRDGKPDLLVEAAGGFTFRNTHVSGPITTASLTADDQLGTSFVNPRLEDFDGDGLLDAASVNGIAFRNISTPTDIIFTAQSTLGLGASVMDLGDFNADGKFDITVTADVSGVVDLLVLENRTASVSGPFATGAYASFSNQFTFAKPAAFGGVVAGDFDGDGFDDIATTNPDADNVSIYPNTGRLKISAAQFGTRVDITVADNPGRIYKGDFDRDGKLDLLLSHSGATTTLTILHNTSTLGNISFSRFDLINPSAATIATIADLDGDGKPEILVTSEVGNRISIYKNIHTTGALGVTSFAAPFNITVTAPRGIATADINVDGRPEIVITRAAGLVVVYENLIPVTLPSIASFTPASGPVGISVVITGTNFDPVPANNIVAFNGTAATVTASSATSITAVVPAGATTGRITVTIAGNVATSATDFTVTPAPTIISFTPGSGPVGTSVTITGTDFDPVPSGNAVTFNGVTASVTASTATTITATVPVGATTGPIAVTRGAHTVTSATDFVVTVPPSITVNQQPGSSTVCAGANATMTVAATGTTNITYQWQQAASAGGPYTDIADGGGYANTGTATLLITTAGNFGAGFYRCAISGDLVATVFSNNAEVVVNAVPAKPSITPSVAPVAGVITVCTTDAVTLSAPAGFSGYSWTGGSTSAQITVTAAGTFTVTVTSAQGCSSVASDAITVAFSNTLCTSNTAPTIQAATGSAPVGGTITIDLTSLISDADNNVVLSSLSIVDQPASGATAAIVNGSLEVDYSGISFSGMDVITIEVCDAFGACTQRELTIEVIGDVRVYNAVSPNGDDRNDVFYIEYIDLLPDTQKNKVTIYNRWGDIVYETTDYNNTDRVFRGQSKNGGELPSGTYYYKISFEGRDGLTGYLSLKR